MRGRCIYTLCMSEEDVQFCVRGTGWGPGVLDGREFKKGCTQFLMMPSPVKARVARNVGSRASPEAGRRVARAGSARAATEPDSGA